MSSDAAGALVKLIGSHTESSQAAIDVAFPCEVISFDPGTLLAAVKPLIKTGGDSPAPIDSVPVLGYKVMFNGVETTLQPTLKKGDKVFVVCADRELKNSLSGKVAAPDTQRMHSRNDAVIVGVIL
ncbi:Gp138 family membrane-puncturing spike protein [Paenibacillus macerans]|uniref:Gp138 family membrane-puncturing spike protein n=1 Tax=Paenibacillus macerans TaxID=44252 RepID=UPI003D316A98